MPDHCTGSLDRPSSLILQSAICIQTEILFPVCCFFTKLVSILRAVLYVKTHAWHHQTKQRQSIKLCKAHLESQNAYLMFRNGVDTSVKANQENG